MQASKCPQRQGDDLERQNFLGDAIIGHGFTVQDHTVAALFEELGHVSCQVWILGCVVLTVATALNQTSIAALTVQLKAEELIFLSLACQLLHAQRMLADSRMLCHLTKPGMVT